MYGISEIQRLNTTPFAKQAGALVARSIDVANQLSADERERVITTGVLPAHVVDRALVDGFDDFALAHAVREQLAGVPQQAA